MKFNAELVREILIKIEDDEFSNRDYIPLNGYTEDQVRYHLVLLRNAGYIDAGQSLMRSGDTHDSFRVLGLTLDGHRFAESIREPDKWEQVKQAFIKAGKLGGATIAVEWLRKLATGEIPLPPLG